MYSSGFNVVLRGRDRKLRLGLARFVLILESKPRCGVSSLLFQKSPKCGNSGVRLDLGSACVLGRDSMGLVGKQGQGLS